MNEALALLANEPRIVAGCTDLFPATDRPDLTIGDDRSILDLTAITELRGIKTTPNGIRIGATTTWTDIATSNLPSAFDALKQAAVEVGSIQIQNSGTIAGNLCNASPAADGVPALLILDAEIELSSINDVRCLPLSAFIQGPRQTALGPAEIVSAVIVPNHALEGVSGFSKLGARKYLVISIAMVAMRLSKKDDTIVDAAVAVGSCSAKAMRLSALEKTIVQNNGLSGTEAQMIEAALSPIDDIRGDQDYRKNAATILIGRLFEHINAHHGQAA